MKKRPLPPDDEHRARRDDDDDDMDVVEEEATTTTRSNKARPPAEFQRSQYGTPVIYARTDLPSVYEVLMSNARMQATTRNNNSKETIPQCPSCARPQQTQGLVGTCTKCMRGVCGTCATRCYTCAMMFCSYCTEMNYEVPSEDRVFCLKHVPNGR